jgi:hypothetical protein
MCIKLHDSKFVMDYMYMYIIAIGQNKYDPWVMELSKPCSCQWDNVTHKISSKNNLFMVRSLWP